MCYAKGNGFTFWMYQNHNLQMIRSGFNDSLCFSSTETGQFWGELQSVKLQCEKHDWEEKGRKKKISLTEYFK